MCHICKYYKVKDIDRALLAGTTPASLRKQYKSFSTPNPKKCQVPNMREISAKLPKN